MKTFINKISEVGISEVTKTNLLPFIRLTNLITFVTILFGIMYQLLSFSIGKTEFGVLVLGYTVLVSLVYVFNKYEYYKTSRLWFVFLVNLGLSTNTLYLGEEAGISFFYFVSASVPFILFDSKEFKEITISVFFAALCFISIQADLFSPIEVLDENQQNILYYLSLVSAFLWTIFNFFYLANRNNKALKKISDQNRTIKSTLEQKDVLLKEVHHRVKNNLQVITSLLSLQSSVNNTPIVKEQFDTCQYRINSMAMVHEMLYQTETFSEIAYGDYLKELANRLISSIKGDNHNIKFELISNNLTLNIDTAIPLGLLINEILTNSLKYGIIGDAQGEIYVHLNKKGSEEYSMAIGDNGIGFSKEEEATKNTSLGLRLIQSLSRQLEGQIKRDFAKKGTHYVLTFKSIKS